MTHLSGIAETPREIRGDISRPGRRFKKSAIQWGNDQCESFAIRERAEGKIGQVVGAPIVDQVVPKSNPVGREGSKKHSTGADCESASDHLKCRSGFREDRSLRNYIQRIST
jgi:hypothetical protein